MPYHSDECAVPDVTPNLLFQDFSAKRPDGKWSGDITYLRTIQGWLYLAVIPDLCRLGVIGWATSTCIDAELACTALRAALTRGGKPIGVIIHTGRGSDHYCWDRRNLIGRYELIAGMNRRGDCYDDALVKSFLYSLKIGNAQSAPQMQRNALHEAFSNTSKWRITAPVAIRCLDMSVQMLYVQA